MTYNYEYCHNYELIQFIEGQLANQYRKPSLPYLYLKVKV